MTAIHATLPEFAISAQPRPGVPLEVLEHSIDEVIGDYTRRAPTKLELARAKAQLVAGATFRRDSQFEMASAYGRALAVGLTASDVQQWPSRILAVKGDAVRQAALNALVKKKSVTAYLTPSAK